MILERARHFVRRVFGLHPQDAGALDLPATIFDELEIEARERNIGVGTLILDILEEHLRGRRQRPRLMRFTLRKVNLNDPLVNWTPDEEQYADESMKIFREEDR